MEANYIIAQYLHVWITDCDSLPERNQIAPQRESTQQLFSHNGIAINTLVMC